MLAFSLNPGFVPILAGLMVLALPRGLRPPAMGLSAVAAIILLLDREFGAAAVIEQMGLPVVPLRLDALNRIFGIAMLLALTIISIYSSARRNRYEDAAILILCGASVSALFVGDLVSFVAAASLAGLAAAWVVSASPLAGAARAGARLLIWHGLEGLLFLVGVAFHLSAGAESSILTQLSLSQIGGGFVFAALLIRVGAPFAHVWLKDVVSHASPAGAAALTSFTTMLGVYALARMFPAEPLLTFVGAAMIIVGALFAAASDDLRSAGAYAQTAQTGVCVALVGIGSPLALAAAEAHAFAFMFAFLAFAMALGAVVERTGAARVSGMLGLWRAMPITCVLMVGAALTAAAVPGLAVYATHAVALEAAAQWELRWLWLLIAALPAAVFLALALRSTLAAHGVQATPRRFAEAPFTMLLGSGLAFFFCLSIGMAPGWLYGLMPTELTFQPFALDRTAPQLELLGACGLVFILARAVRLSAKEHDARTLDVDAFYRGPVAAAGRWAGVLLLRIYGAMQAITDRLASGGAGRLENWVRNLDRPYATPGAALANLVCVAGVLVLVLVIVG